MDLFLHLLLHATLSLLVGVLAWQLTKGNIIFCLLAALLSGFAIDFDHLIDYFLAFGWHFDLAQFLRGDQFLQSDKIYVLWHAWEYAIILLLLYVWSKSQTAKGLFLALLLGMILHLSTDVLMNEIPAQSYSLVYRISKGFAIKELVNAGHYERHLKLKQQLIP